MRTRLYFERLHIRALKASLTLMRSPLRDERYELVQMGGPLGVLLDVLAMTVSYVDNASFTVNGTRILICY